MNTTNELGQVISVPASPVPMNEVSTTVIVALIACIAGMGFVVWARDSPTEIATDLCRQQNSAYVKGSFRKDETRFRLVCHREDWR